MVAIVEDLSETRSDLHVGRERCCEETPLQVSVVRLRRHLAQAQGPGHERGGPSLIVPIDDAHPREVALFEAGDAAEMVP